MIFGIVNVRNELVVWLQMLNVKGQAQDLETVIDTGFTGEMSLPLALVTNLGLPLLFRQPVNLGNGVVVNTGVYDATLIWDGIAQQVNVHAIGDEILLGTRLLRGHDLRARVEPGGLVEIERFTP